MKSFESIGNSEVKRRFFRLRIDECCQHISIQDLDLFFFYFFPLCRFELINKFFLILFFHDNSTGVIEGGEGLFGKGEKHIILFLTIFIFFGS